MSHQALSAAVYNKLISEQGEGSLFARVHGRIHPLGSPLRTPLPWLGFSIVIDQPQAYFQQSDDVQAELAIDLWCDKDAGLQAAFAINDVLHTLLHRQPLTIAGMAQGELLCMLRGVASSKDNALVISSKWRLWSSTV